MFKQQSFSTSSMPPSANFAINFDGVTISPSSWATDPQFQGQESILGGKAFLNETGVNVIDRGFGAIFSIFVMIVVYFDTMFSKNATITVEQFYTAGGIIKARLIASEIVSKWTWAATHLQSLNAAWNYGVHGPFWYALGATIQILFLFGILAISLKALAHSAHAICEIARARWGKSNHLPFLFFGFCSSVIITSMLLLGGATTVEILTGMSYAVASFLIPWGIFLQTTVGGVKAIYMASYLHTMMVIVVVVICMITIKHIKVYSSDIIYQYLHQTDSNAEEQCTIIFSKDGAGPNSFYRNDDDKTMMVCGPIEGNIQRSYFSTISGGGLKFGIFNIIRNFGTVFADQSYWQAAIAARPESAAEGYLLGGVCWFAIPFSLATSLGLASNTLMLPITSDESSSRLVPPAVADDLMVDAGAVLILIVLFMTIVSTGSAESIAVSSLVAYDIYREYINPNATGKQILFVLGWLLLSSM
ncbi:hypothetical protein ACHAW5_006696 [Stephanodiscus triporus]|uniref:Uncharacterized protein n=1 Tax=Stephanodiscus triporus TaxID=2934178 RepID=A0ABD3QKF5_9STRA